RTEVVDKLHATRMSPAQDEVRKERTRLATELRTALGHRLDALSRELESIHAWEPDQLRTRLSALTDTARAAAAHVRTRAPLVLREPPRESTTVRSATTLVRLMIADAVMLSLPNAENPLSVQALVRLAAELVIALVALRASKRQLVLLTACMVPLT